MKNSARRIPARLQDIKDAIRNVFDDIGDMSLEQFLSDGKTQRAVSESLIVMGEAANSIMDLAPVMETSHPEAWHHFKEIYGMRIVLTHQYFRADPQIIWDTVQNDIPALEHIVSTIDIVNDGGDGSGGGMSGGPR